MAEPVRVGVLRFEHYHANFWTKAFKQTADAELVGFWEPDDALAEAAVATHGIRRFDDINALIESCGALAICSATARHVELVERVAAKGKAILCEKPIAHTEAGCRRIHDIVAESGVIFMQSFPKRFDPINHELRALVEEGALGDITMVRVRHGHNHGTMTPGFGDAWFTDPALSGGGTLIDEGVHAADFLRWVFGEPETVSATISSSALGLRVEDSALAIFTWASGLVAEVSTSWSFAAADTSIEIYGTEGTVLLGGVDIASRPGREKDFLRVFRRGAEGGSWSSSPTVPAFKTGVFHEHVAWNFAAALRNGRPMPVTLEDGWWAFAMIEAAYRSVATGRRETIAYPG
jgi:predicted dehydrogenase